MAKLTINGNEFELAYTIKAQQDLEETYSGLSNIMDIFDNSADNEVFSDLCIVTSILMNAADERNRLMARMTGKEYEGANVLTAEELSILITAADCGDVIAACIQAMMEAITPSIKLEEKEEKGLKKNASTVR